MLLTFGVLLLFTSSTAIAGGLDQQLLTFVKDAVPQGRIVFCGEVASNGTGYDLFVVQQETSRGALVITSGSADPSAKSYKVLFADTSLDFARDQGLIPSEVLSQLCVLLGITGSPSSQPRAIAPAEDICPIGAALNTVLGPIAGFTFRFNCTLGILQELQQSDAIPVNPSSAPAGSILVCPSVYSGTGPVRLGAVGILGSDRQVYGLDIRKGCGWICLGKLETWIEKYSAKNQLFGFLLRARPERAST
jgi:hypothetical protein